MEIELFDIREGVCHPTKHCYSIQALNNIMEKFPDNYSKIFIYIQYMTSMDTKTNPYAGFPDDIKSETIIKDVDPTINPLDSDIKRAISCIYDIYRSNPHYRAFIAVKKNFDKFLQFLETEEWTTGKEGSSSALLAANKNMPDMKAAYDTAEKDYMKTVLNKKTWAGQEDNYDKKEYGDEE